MPLPCSLPVRALLAAMALTAVTAACSSDDGEAAATSSTTTSVDVTTTTAPTEGPLAITAKDYAFDGLPDAVPAGTELTLTNASAAEVHEMAAFRLPDGEARSAEALVALPQADLEALVAGPPSLVLVAPPGSDGFTAFGDGTLTEPGRYLFICTIPTGADPAAYLAAAQASQGGPVDVPGGPPHFVNGMYAEVTVTP